MELLVAVTMLVCQSLPPEHNGTIYQKCTEVRPIAVMPCTIDFYFNEATQQHEKIIRCCTPEQCPEMRIVIINDNMA